MRLIDADLLVRYTKEIEGDAWACEFESRILDRIPTIEPNLVINPDEVKRGDVTMIGSEIVVMHYDDYMEMMLKSAAVDDGSWERFAAEPCEDAISREDAIKEIRGWFQIIELNPDILIDNIKCLPSVAPSRPSGEWKVYYDNPLRETWWECSECHELVVEKGNFCPNCGAKMSKESK